MLILNSCKLQYINAAKEMQCEQQDTRDRRSEANHSSSSFFLNTIIGGTLQAGGSNKILSKCTNGSCSSHPTGNEGKKSENHKTRNFATHITSTGDAAQDMLNVYLGPFLKQSSSKELSVQAIESKGLPSVQTIETKGLPSIQAFEPKGLPSMQAFESKRLPSTFELNKQIRSCLLSKEEGPLMMKKKSSLKDKVALFFD